MLNHLRHGGIKKRNFLVLMLANLSCFFRYSGVVTGVGDADPCRWPMSKWRLLMVCEILCFDSFNIYVCWYIASFLLYFEETKQ